MAWQRLSIKGLKASSGRHEDLLFAVTGNRRLWVLKEYEKRSKKEALALRRWCGKLFGR